VGARYKPYILPRTVCMTGHMRANEMEGKNYRRVEDALGTYM
jgi:hypothetical protein